MSKNLHAWVFAVLLAAASACQSGRHSAAGFRLPENGDAELGRTAFLDLGCNRCHSVSGVEIPPADTPEMNLMLGGELHELRTDGYLVTSVIHPSHKLREFRGAVVGEEGISRMPDFTLRMTVRQMVDIVAFLQQHYRLRPPPTYP